MSNGFDTYEKTDLEEDQVSNSQKTDLNDKDLLQTDSLHIEKMAENAEKLKGETE